MHRVIGMMVVCGVVGSLGASVARGQGITIDSVRAGVAASRAGITDFAVSFTSDALNPTDNLFARSHRVVVGKGEKMFVDHEFGPMVEIDPTLKRRVTSFDGRGTTIYEVNRSSAMSITTREHEMSTKGMGFFDLMMWNPYATGRVGSQEMDLESLLRSPNVTVRSTLEDVGGVACVVVDEREPESSAVAYTAWLDPARGFAPLRQRYFDTVSGRTQIDLETDELAEVKPGLWAPVRGRRTALLGPGRHDPSVELLVEVDGWAMGAPAVTFNSGVEDRTFDVVTTLAPGVTYLDRDSGLARTIAGRDFKKLGDSVEMQVADAVSKDGALGWRISGGASTSGGASGGASLWAGPVGSLTLVAAGITMSGLGLMTFIRRR